MSPKFKELNGFVFKIYSNEEKRMHIHIVKAENEAKFWLEPEIELAENFGFNSKELSFIEKILTEPTLKSKACLKCLYFTKIISVFMPLSGIFFVSLHHQLKE